MEHSDFYIATPSEESAPVLVDALYYVFADDDYLISHLPIPDTYIFVATLSGCGTLTIDNHCYSLQQDDIFLFDASASDFAYRSSATNWNFWWFEFRCSDRSFLALPFNTPLNVPLNSIHLKLCEEALFSLKLNNRKAAGCLLAALLCLVQESSPGPGDGLNQTDIFRRADRYIRSNLSTVTVASLAEYLGISDHTLLNVFQSLLGMRTIDYIQKVKINMAQYLLSHAKMPIREVAEQLGYGDPFIFSKSFRRLCGISPSEFQKRIVSNHTPALMDVNSPSKEK